MTMMVSSSTWKRILCSSNDSGTRLLTPSRQRGGDQPAQKTIRRAQNAIEVVSFAFNPL
jgi:hypothetical protein